MTLVPEQQPPARQGDLRLPHHRPERRTPRSATASCVVQGRQRRRHDDLELARRLPDGDVPDDRDGRRLRLHAGHRRDRARRRAATRSSSTTPGRAPSPAATEDDAERRRRRARTQIIKFLADYNGTPYPFDSIGAVADRCRRGSATCSRSRRRSTSRRATAQPQHARARDRAPVVRQQRLAEAVERHLAQRGLGDLVAVELDATSSTARITPAQQFTNNYNSTDAARRAGTPRRPSCRPRRTCSTRSRSTRAPAMMIEGLRQILGETAFQAMIKALDDRATATATPTRPLHRARQAGRGGEGRLRGVQPRQARHVLPAVAVTARQADDDADDVLPEHDGAGRPSAARCRRRSSLTLGAAGQLRRVHAGHREDLHGVDDRQRDLDGG